MGDFKVASFGVSNFEFNNFEFGKTVLDHAA